MLRMPSRSVPGFYFDLLEKNMHAVNFKNSIQKNTLYLYSLTYSRQFTLKYNYFWKIATISKFSNNLSAIAIARFSSPNSIITKSRSCSTTHTSNHLLNRQLDFTNAFELSISTGKGVITLSLLSFI